MTPSTTAATAWANAAAATNALVASATPDDAASLTALAAAAAAVHEALAAYGVQKPAFQDALRAAFSAALSAFTAPATSSAVTAPSPSRWAAPPQGAVMRGHTRAASADTGASMRHSAGSAVTVDESEEEELGSGSSSSRRTPQPSATGAAAAGAAQPQLRRVVAVFPFSSDAANELDLRQGDVVEVLSTHSSGWWTGRARSGHAGFFPSNYCRPLSPSEESRLLRKRYARRARRAEGRDITVGSKGGDTTKRNGDVTKTTIQNGSATPVKTGSGRGMRPPVLTHAAHHVASPAEPRRSAECA